MGRIRPFSSNPSIVGQSRYCASKYFAKFLNCWNDTTITMNGVREILQCTQISTAFERHFGIRQFGNHHLFKMSHFHEICDFMSFVFPHAKWANLIRARCCVLRQLLYMIGLLTRNDQERKLHEFLAKLSLFRPRRRELI